MVNITFDLHKVNFKKDNKFFDTLLKYCVYKEFTVEQMNEVKP